MDSAPKHNIEEHLPALKRFVRSLGLEPDDVEDIVQDTVLQYLRTLKGSLAPISNISAWLCRVAKNITINKSKKQHEERLTASAALDDDGAVFTNIVDIMASESDSPEDMMLREMFWHELDTALASLPEEQRMVFTLTEFEGLSTKEVAEAMRTNSNTVLSRKHYAVKYLRTRLKAFYEGLLTK